MKKAIKLLFSVACFSILSLSACGGNTPPAHEHTWSSGWSSDATNHWHECETCGAKKDEAAHEYDNDHDATCNVCGYERSLGDHVAETSWSHDSAHHWHACAHDGCELKFDYDEHTADLHGFCDTCGEYLGELKSMPYNATPTYENRAEFGTLAAGTYYYRINFTFISGDLIFVSTNMPSESYVFYWKDKTTGVWKQSSDTCKVGPIYTGDGYGYLVITLTSQVTDVYITYYTLMSI